MSAIISVSDREIGQQAGSAIVHGDRATQREATVVRSATAEVITKVQTAAIQGDGVIDHKIGCVTSNTLLSRWENGTAAESECLGCGGTHIFVVLIADEELGTRDKACGAAVTLRAIQRQLK